MRSIDASSCAGAVISACRRPFNSVSRDMSQSTSLSLLDRAATSADDEAWERLVVIYHPLLLRWLRTSEVQTADAEPISAKGDAPHQPRSGGSR